MYSEYTKEQVKKFVGLYGDIIIEGITNKGLFFPAVVGQLTVESRFGASDLSAQHNNYGGIKTTGSVFSSGQVSMDTTEFVNGREIPAKQSFATYSDFKNFMADYVRVLALPSYVSAGVYTATDPYQQVLAIGKGGYSTRDPKQYLKFAEGRIDACIDLFAWGKINSQVPAPPANPNDQFSGSSFWKTISGVFDNSIKPAAK